MLLQHDIEKEMRRKVLLQMFSLVMLIDKVSIDCAEKKMKAKVYENFHESFKVLRQKDFLCQFQEFTEHNENSERRFNAKIDLIYIH